MPPTGTEPRTATFRRRRVPAHRNRPAGGQVNPHLNLNFQLDLFGHNVGQEGGADTPTVADPMKGNPIAGLPKKDVGIAFMWEQLNRGKRCIGLDVSKPEGREIALDLLRQADVFVINLLPQARKRFGVDVEDVQAVNPKIIYARATGHGDRGPEREIGGFDHTDFWARTSYDRA